MSLRFQSLAAILLIIGSIWPQFSHASSESLRIALMPPGHYEIITGTNRWTVYLDGVIESGADTRLAKELSHIPNSPINVYFNSPGGDFLTGMKLGRLLRTKAAWTHIGKYNPKEKLPESGECFSACALAYLGGYYRFGAKGSSYGVHRTWKDGGSADSDLDVGQIISAATSAYIREMGVDGGLLDLIVSAGKSEIYLLSDAQQKTLKITNGGRASAEWSLQLIQGLYYLRGVQNTMYGQGKFLLYCTKQELMLHSIYEVGPDKSEAISKGGWFHFLLIDGGAIPLPNPSRTSDDHGYLNSAFVLTPEQIRRVLTARESVGHAMQLSRDAPTFVGYKVDLNDASSKQLREFVSTCSTKK